ncbi:MAG: hypothetical protein R3C05_28220 [Pirellulaceae bacterium]
MGDPLPFREGVFGEFTLDAQCVQFSVFNESFGIGGTAGNRTLEIEGGESTVP